MGQYPLGDFSQNLSIGNRITPPEPANIDFTGFNSDHFFSMIANIDSLSNEDLMNLIKNHIDIIVEKTLSNDKSMGSILSHPKFVDAYHRIISKIPIDYDRRLFVNKLTYEYEMVDHDNTILSKFRDASIMVNENTTRSLIRLGLSNDIANNLAVSRYSSRNEGVNVQRLNFTMCKYYSDTFTEQMLIWIYEQLFNRIGELFISSMLEVYSDQEFEEFPPDFRDIYGNISLAILTILNNMPSASIKEVIIKYIDRYSTWVKKYRVLPRFTMRCLSNDYERIVNVVDRLILEGYDVP